MAVQTFRIEMTDDERAEFFVGERKVGDLNHDEHGWQGIREAEKLFKNIAQAVGADFERR